MTVDYAIQNELKHFLEAIWNHEAPITLQEALCYLDNHDESQSEIYSTGLINTVVRKYPNIFYPIYKLQIQMIENTLGQYWWDNHKAAMHEAIEEEKQRQLEEMERRRKADDMTDEVATLRVIKKRMGIRYYLMPWLIAGEKKKLARIAALESELDRQVRTASSSSRF